MSITAVQSFSVQTMSNIQKPCTKVTRCGGPSTLLRPRSLIGDPIMNEPGGHQRMRWVTLVSGTLNVTHGPYSSCPQSSAHEGVRPLAQKNGRGKTVVSSTTAWSNISNVT